jgi:hypothetical protein
MQLSGLFMRTGCQSRRREQGVPRQTGEGEAAGLPGRRQLACAKGWAVYLSFSRL